MGESGKTLSIMSGVEMETVVKENGKKTCGLVLIHLWSFQLCLFHRTFAQSLNFGNLDMEMVDIFIDHS